MSHFEPTDTPEPDTPDEIAISILTLTLDALEASIPQLAGILARYVVMTRHETHCRNADLVISTTVPGRFLVISKWERDDAARRHLDSFVMADMAREAVPLLRDQPVVDLYDSISAHDLA